MKLAIININNGNIMSVANMVDSLNYEYEIIEDPKKLIDFDKAILPGVGSFDKVISRVEPWSEYLHRFIQAENKKFLGICVGLQMLFSESEEGKKKGLSFIPGKVKKINHENRLLKVPHMGWNTVCDQKESGIFKEFDENPRFYFVHSYHVVPEDESIVTSRVKYGEKLVASIEYKNIYGVQFHPEKSHKFGKILIKNFINA